MPRNANLNKSNHLAAKRATKRVVMDIVPEWTFPREPINVSSKQGWFDVYLGLFIWTSLTQMKNLTAVEV